MLLRHFSLIILVVFLASCSLSPVSNPEPVTIRCLVIPPAGVDTLTSEIQSSAGAFSQLFPGVTVEVTGLSPADLQGGSYDLDLLAGPDMDFDVIIADLNAVPEFAISGAFRDLAPSLQVPIREDGEGNFNQSFFPAALDVLRWKGKQVGLAIEVDPRVMFYNRDLFDMAGVPEPAVDWTVTDFLTAARALSASSGVRFPFGSWGAEATPFIYQNLDTTPDLDPGSPLKILTQPSALEGIRRYAELALIQGVMPQPSDLAAYAGDFIQRQVILAANNQLTKSILQAQADLEMAVENGDVALWIGPYSGRGGHYKHWDFKWGILPLPSGARPATVVEGWAAFITPHAGSYQESLDWIDYLTAHPPLHRGLPARRSVLDDELWQAPENAPAAIEHILETSFLAPGWQDSAITQEIQGPLFSVYAGELSIDDALDKILLESSE